MQVIDEVSLQQQGAIETETQAGDWTGLKQTVIQTCFSVAQTNSVVRFSKPGILNMNINPAYYQQIHIC